MCKVNLVSIHLLSVVLGVLCPIQFKLYLVDSFTSFSLAQVFRTTASQDCRCLFSFIILRHLANRESKIFLSNKCVFFTRCLPIELPLNEPTSVVHVSNVNFFHQIVAKTMLARVKFFADIAKNARKAQTAKKPKTQEKQKKQNSQKS